MLKESASSPASILLKEHMKSELITNPVVVFDMDGTLYELDGENKGFKNSTLERLVLQNALAFIQQQEQCTSDEAQKLVTQGVSDGVGLSNFASQRYGITRQQYFEAVWDIDPRSVFEPAASVKYTFAELQQTEVLSLLLTAAPSVWANLVTKLLGLSETFSQVITGEKFSSKKEVFAEIRQQFPSAKLFSVGDQVITDIEPAEAVGFTGLLVKGPNDLPKLLSLVKGNV